MLNFNFLKLHILNLSRNQKKLLAICLDFFICVFSVWIAFGLRLEQWSILEGMQWWALAVSIALSFPFFIIYGLYQTIFRYLGLISFKNLIHVFLIYALLYLFIFTFIGVNGVPRSIGIIQPIIFFIGSAVSRFFISNWLNSSSYFFSNTLRPKRIALIYGAGLIGRQLAKSLISNKEILIKGFIDDDDNLKGSTIDGIYIYPSTDLKNLIIKLGVTDVLLAVHSTSQSDRTKIIASLQTCKVRVQSVSNSLDYSSFLIPSNQLQDLDMDDLLNRKVVLPDLQLLKKTIKGNTIVVTGAGGSIGSELCRQIIKLLPNKIVLVDFSEYGLYKIYEELKMLIHIQNNGSTSALTESFSDTLVNDTISIKLIARLASVRDRDQMYKIFYESKPSIVFHAAAYKHVPLVEENAIEAIRNNVFGTITCAEVCRELGVSNFILISTDKAVRPTNVMGASKRISELYLQALTENTSIDCLTKYSMVRFGNVLGSSGSVAPLFRSQIKDGGPITLTHRDVTRYFMTIPEAAQLVIQTVSLAKGGEVFVLDMGQPVKIYDLAIKMIYLSGLIIRDELNPHGDIEIKITGLRPGEKLYEELLIGNNPQPTDHPKIMKAHEEFIQFSELIIMLEQLEIALNKNNNKNIQEILMNLVAGYKPTTSIN
jgi:FlaA1/EpsC-like NDP-sugar epimerase